MAPILKPTAVNYLTSRACAIGGHDLVFQSLVTLLKKMFFFLIYDRP